MFGVVQGSYTIAQIVAIRSAADAGGMQHEKKETDPRWDDVAMVRVLQVLLFQKVVWTASRRRTKPSVMTLKAMHFFTISNALTG